MALLLQSVSVGICFYVFLFFAAIERQVGRACWSGGWGHKEYPTVRMEKIKLYEKASPLLCAPAAALIIIIALPGSHVLVFGNN